MASADESEDDEEVQFKSACKAEHVDISDIHSGSATALLQSQVADALEARLSTLQHLSPEEAATMLGRMPPRQAGQLALASVEPADAGKCFRMRECTRTHKGLVDG